MSRQEHLHGVFEGKRHQKIVLVASVFLFLLLELLIYIAAAAQAGQKSRVIITDSNGAKVYETAGAVLTNYEKLVFENNFGPLSRYQLRVETESLAFPFRAWLSAAVGIPVGLILLVAFIVRAYLSLLYGDKTDEERKAAESASEKNVLGSLFLFFRNISIFHIGVLTLLAVLVLWMVPNFMRDFAKVSMAAIQEFRWFFAATAVFLALLVVWIIYLRYKLSKQMLENQFNIEKFKVETQLLLESKSPRLLADSAGENREP